MATYVSTNAIIISAAVATSTSGNINLYAPPVNSYAILNVYSSGACTISVGGQVVHVFAAAGSIQGVYVGPGKFLATSGNAGTLSISGVEFTNAS